MGRTTYKHVHACTYAIVVHKTGHWKGLKTGPIHTYSWHVPVYISLIVFSMQKQRRRPGFYHMWYWFLRKETEVALSEGMQFGNLSTRSAWDHFHAHSWVGNANEEATHFRRFVRLLSLHGGKCVLETAALAKNAEMFDGHLAQTKLQLTEASRAPKQSYKSLEHEIWCTRPE